MAWQLIKKESLCYSSDDGLYLPKPSQKILKEFIPRVKSKGISKILTLSSLHMNKKISEIVTKFENFQ